MPGFRAGDIENFNKLCQKLNWLSLELRQHEWFLKRAMAINYNLASFNPILFPIYGWERL
ncbi:MAG: hypothetical protein EA366_06685 [Spirulina sp. DLM2.Bin59]|nr:MAG: hypothetical protein EA366_06685 [Spirulina sp. DLM2.Bin59]